ncbi:MAG: DUF4301 family protein [Bacteroidaceae bacterium]
MITVQDKEQLKRKGITEQQIEAQLSQFKTGFPYLKLSAAASAEKGILIPSDAEMQEYLTLWENYCNESHKVVKFVPASGAASRMFKNLFEFLEGEETIPSGALKTFFTEIKKFAFAHDLEMACEASRNKTLDELIASNDYKDIVSVLLNADGLNYGSLPKGVLQFHKYADGSRTPVEEHLAEAALYAAGKSKQAAIHFTVSAEHRTLFKSLVEKKVKVCEARYGVKYHVTFSEQKPSTDTLAATPQGEPFRNEDGSLLFRPGGHGALIENLNDLTADIVFVKNIDNIVPDRLKADTITYKKLLAGLLVSLQAQAFAYLRKLDSGIYSMNELREMLQFVQKKLYCKNPETKHLEDTELAIYLKQKLNRPMRVCGMVKNVGEPGGGPFLAYNEDGTISLQILESSQIDMNDPEAKEMFKKGTHFNPVDLVCSLCNYNGEKFHLPNYVDKTTGFISNKSKNGKELQALELPGLWNGAMSNWNTVFVEVPLTTFNPVKTVNDLLRDEHQSSF